MKFSSNGLVSFKEIEGMNKWNNCRPRKIKLNAEKIDIWDNSHFSGYKSGRVIFNVKFNKAISFDSFKERIKALFKEGEPYNNLIDIAILIIKRNYKFDFLLF